MQHLVIIQQLQAARSNIIHIYLVQHRAAVYVLALCKQQHLLLILTEGIFVHTKRNAVILAVLIIKQQVVGLTCCQVIYPDECMPAFMVYLGIVQAILHGIKARHILYLKRVVLPEVIKCYLFIALGKRELRKKYGNKKKRKYAHDKIISEVKVGRKVERRKWQKKINP